MSVQWNLGFVMVEHSLFFVFHGSAVAMSLLHV